MFQNPIKSITEFRQNRRLAQIAKQVRNGQVPKDVDLVTVCKALGKAKTKGPLEMTGLLTAKQFRDGKLFKDHGLVGVRSVSLEFADLLVDALLGEAASTIATFDAHEMGDGSTAESSADSELISAQDGRNIGSQTHGATSNIYATTATITASGAYTVIEHGLFDTSGATERLMDRTVIDSFVVATDDEVEWTYTLTVATAG